MLYHTLPFSEDGGGIMQLLEYSSAQDGTRNAEKCYTPADSFRAGRNSPLAVTGGTAPEVRDPLKRRLTR